MTDVKAVAVADTRWLSVHLAFQSQSIYGRDADAVILDVVAPLVRELETAKWIESFFFIRYAERGPHIRLRLTGEPLVLAEAVRGRVLQRILSTYPEARSVELDTDGPVIAVATPVNQGAITELRWSVYELEIRRYGGPHAMAVAQQVFHASSVTATALLETMGTERASRLGRALLAMLVLVHTFSETRESAAALVQYFQRSYLPGLAARYGTDEHVWDEAFRVGYERQAERLIAFVQDAWSRLVTNEPLTDALDDYRYRLLQPREDLHRLLDGGRIVLGEHIAANWSQCVHWLTPSYLHMANNRLGVSVAEEAYLAHVLHRALVASTNDSVDDSVGRADMADPGILDGSLE